jgi:uncharacterized protein YfeS/predicted DNA-binding WGR domain protein
MPRYEFTDDQSNKFWEISQSGTELHIAWGAIGTAGRTQTKTFADAGKASSAMAKLSVEKLGKGYVLAGAGGLGASSPVPSATTRYFDDEEEGLARATSHPNFVAVAAENFYYDCADDFSPFGSDDGSDTLSSLQEWYQNGGKDAKVMSFLKELLADWNFGLPKNVIRAEPAGIEKWLSKDDMNETFFLSECRARVATAFGQLKIAGVIIPALHDEAVAALRCLLWMNERATTKYPDWQHGSDDRAALVVMQSALSKLSP